MLASILLLGLGLVAAIGCVNALRPARSLVLVISSWAAAWVTIELAPHLIALSGLIAALLIALGALEHVVGVAGLVLLVVADAIGLAFT